MYDDAWFAAVSPAQSRPDAPRHNRRVSLLKQPNEEDHTDAGISDEPLVSTAQADEHDFLPNPTVPRRANSWADSSYATREAAGVKWKTRELTGASSQSSRRASQVLKPAFDFDESYDETFDELLDSSLGRYQLYFDQLQVSRRHLDSLLKETDTNLHRLAYLSTSFHNVETQTSAFQGRCEGLVDDQRRLSSLVDDVEYNLQFYNYLDPITRRLNVPGARHFVRSDDFAEMLSQLDECLDYMKSHPGQLEAATYRARYRVLLTRGLTLIRVHFTTTLRETAAEVSQRIADKQLNDTTMPTLLYTKFRVNAPELKRLALEIQRRAIPDSMDGVDPQAEYQSLVNELHQSYGAARGRLVVPLIRHQMDEISMAPSTSKDLVALARSSMSYIRGICMEEYDLWHDWFEGDDGLYAFLETVCESLYDYLRPRTIRETQLPKLCELCTLIQARYMEEAEEESDVEPRDQLDFGPLVQPALEDAQTRLVFLTLAVLRDDIEKFKPKLEDLNYPARNRDVVLSGTKTKGPILSGRKSSVQVPPTAVLDAGRAKEDGDGEEHRWRFDASDSFQGWYPTLQKAIWLLSKIYRLVNSSVFDDLAHQVVHQTTHSLMYASTQIANKASPADAQLFLLKQFLILKQQIVAFDIEFVTPEVEVDFSNVTNTFWELRERGGLFNPGNIVRLVGSSLMPRVVENMLDAKTELDAQLRSVIGDFTNGFAARMTISVSESACNREGFDGGEAMSSLKATVEREAKLLRSKLDEYLEDVRTKDTLAGAVQDQIVSNYEDFFDRHISRGAHSGHSTSKKGKGRQDDVWDPDTFADWATTVFGLGTKDEDGEEGSGRSSVNGSMSS